MRLGVVLYEDIVGYLSKTVRGKIAFRFTDSYLSLPHRPVLSQYFEDDLYRTYTGRNRSLPPFFANLIPEPGALRDLIERSLEVEPGDDLALLEAVSRDLPGAVEIIPVDVEDLPAQAEIQVPITNRSLE